MCSFPISLVSLSGTAFEKTSHYKKNTFLPKNTHKTGGGVAGGLEMKESKIYACFVRY